MNIVKKQGKGKRIRRVRKIKETNGLTNATGATRIRIINLRKRRRNMRGGRDCNIIMRIVHARSKSTLLPKGSLRMRLDRETVGELEKIEKKGIRSRKRTCQGKI